MQRRDRALVVGFLAPGVLLAVGFILLPLLWAVQLAFVRLDSFVGTPSFVGLANFRALAEDPRFWHAFEVGVVYAGGSIILQAALGVAIALLLNESFRGVTLVRGVSLLPYILPTVVVALVFAFMLDPNLGVVNAQMKRLGLPNVLWFDSPGWALFTVILVGVWTWTPFVTTSVLAGLQAIPDDLYDAARIDGASAWRRFWNVTLPVLRPVLAVVVLLRGIWMFNKFDLIWLLTKGGPLQATEHLPVLTYQKTFGLFDVGGGAAVATVSFLVLAAAVWVYFRVFPLEDA